MWKKLNAEDKKDMLHTFMKRIFTIVFLLGLYAAAFGIKSALQLMKTCAEFIVITIIGIYPILFAFSVKKCGFQKTMTDMGPTIYIRSILMCALFDFIP